MLVVCDMHSLPRAKIFAGFHKFEIVPSALRNWEAGEKCGDRVQWEVALWAGRNGRRTGAPGGGSLHHFDIRVFYC